jgi:hypothetical protein
VKFNLAACAQLKASDHAPPHIVGVRIVEPKVRATAFRPFERRDGKEAP